MMSGHADPCNSILRLPVLNGARKSLTDTERLDWLRLIRSENVGPITFHRLLQRYGSAARALDVLPELAAKGGARRIRIASKADTAAEMEQVAASGARPSARIWASNPSQCSSLPRRADRVSNACS